LKYKNYLEARLMNAFRQGMDYQNFGKPSYQLPRDEYEFQKAKWLQQGKIYGAAFLRLKEQYKNLTGIDWVCPEV
jgi:hypothetical protein